MEDSTYTEEDHHLCRHHHHCHHCWDMMMNSQIIIEFPKDHLLNSPQDQHLNGTNTRGLMGKEEGKIGDGETGMEERTGIVTPSIASPSST